MKKYIVIATALLLSACASQPAPSALELTLTPVLSAQPAHAARTIQLISKDSRQYGYVAVVDHGTENVEIIDTKNNIASTFKQALAQQLSSEGMTITPTASSRVAINIKQALVKVKQDLVKYDMSSQLHVELLVTTPKGTFSKSYSARATKQNPLTVKRDEIAQGLEKMMNSILNEIAKDGELRQYLTENV